MRVALYIRVSTEEQALNGLSIEAQTDALESWAKSNKCKVVDKYIDAGISARKKATKRPSLQRLLNDVRAGKVDLVVFTKLDRWFRNIAEYYKVQEVLEQYHVDWKTIHEDYDTSTASGRLKINIMLSVAQDEADRTSERIKVVFDSKLSRNEPLNGKAPYGYKNENKQITIDSETSPMVKAAFAEYLKTGAINKMISAAPELHLTYKRARAMLKSTAYIGDWCGVSIEPILTKNEYEAIQSMQKHNVRKTRENRIYLFSGLIICAECGRRMGARAYKRAHCETVYYICQGHYLYKGCSVATSFREDRIEQYLLDHIEDEAKAAMEWSSKQVTHDYSKDRSAVKKKLSKLSELYVDDLIEIEDYKRQYSDLTSQLESIPDVTTKANKKVCSEIFKDGWKDVYAELNRLKRQEFWRLIIREIKVYDSGKIDFEILI